MAYDSPKWVDVGDIDLQASQDGALGIVVPDGFRDWLLNSGAMQNLNKNVSITENADGTFNITGADSDFDVNDKLTWYLLLE